MGKQEEERLEMTNGGMEGGRPGREVSPAGAQDQPETGGKGKGLGISSYRFIVTMCFLFKSTFVNAL